MPHPLKRIPRAVWNSFEHGVFMQSKGAAYSAILTIFPAFIILAWVLQETGTTKTFFEQISIAVGRVLPPGSRQTAISYFTSGKHRPLKEIMSVTFLMIGAASGVMISWMNGFRRAYGIEPNPWGFWMERAVALMLVVFGFAPMMTAMLVVAFGEPIEGWMVAHLSFVPRFYILVLFSLARWMIAGVTSVTVLMLIYHFGIPRVQPWFRVLPGAILATFLWFPITALFGWYVTHLATYNLIYGPLGTGIALLVWLYLISIIVLLGAEYNALVCPRGEF